MSTEPVFHFTLNAVQSDLPGGKWYVRLHGLDTGSLSFGPYQTAAEARRRGVHWVDQYRRLLGDDIAEQLTLSLEVA